MAAIRITRYPESLVRAILMGCFALLSGQALALTYDPATVTSQLETAPVVVEITVTGRSSSTDPKLGLVSLATARIDRLLRLNDDSDDGDRPADLTFRDGQSIVIRGVGGESADLGMVVPGLARPHVGRKYRAYLKPAGEGSFEVVAFEKGLVPLDGIRQFSRNRTDGSNGDGDGPFLYWERSFFPLPYFMSGPSFQGLSWYVPAIDSSFKTWRDVGDTRYEFLALGCTRERKTGNDGINTIILITDKWDFDPAAIAITRNFYVAGTTSRAGQILDSDILLNAVDHRFSINLAAGTHDVQNIVTHEVGHFLGLGHEVAPVSVDAAMNATASTSETKKRTLHPNDLAGIRDAYGGSGMRFASGPQTPDCGLDGGGACLAVHGGPSHPGWGTWAAVIYLVLLIAGGRLIVRRLPT